MRERQTMLRLPDLYQMQVKTTVHESKVDSLKRGMLARIRIQDRDYQGTVTSVATQAGTVELVFRQRQGICRHREHR